MAALPGPVVSNEDEGTQMLIKVLPIIAKIFNSRSLEISLIVHQKWTDEMAYPTNTQQPTPEPLKKEMIQELSFLKSLAN